MATDGEIRDQQSGTTENPEAGNGKSKLYDSEEQRPAGWLVRKVEASDAAAVKAAGAAAPAAYASLKRSVAWDDAAASLGFSRAALGSDFLELLRAEISTTIFQIETGRLRPTIHVGIARIQFRHDIRARLHSDKDVLNSKRRLPVEIMCPPEIAADVKTEADLLGKLAPNTSFRIRERHASLMTPEALTVLNRLAIDEVLAIAHDPRYPRVLQLISAPEAKQ
jgi:hypothetical protein